jgi:hypothetical protein
LDVEGLRHLLVIFHSFTSFLLLDWQ